MTEQVFAVIDATWPPAARSEAGGFVIREGKGGGSRVSAASRCAPWEACDLKAAIAAQRALGQNPKFQIRPGDAALDTALEARGFVVTDPTVIYDAPIDALQGEVPPVTAFAHWPPLQIARDLWTDLGIGPARQAIMERADAPKCCILGRKTDRAAGTMFVAIHDAVAMIHALAILPEMRRMGLARAMIHEAARWAAENGAHRMMLVVTEANAEANALYRVLGLEMIGRYHFRSEAAK
ncbi:GNAT family N-acetyltransferase [Sedimentimonas flavescens]|uniref:GNAT family N-acetyltransferase n=1 Tax=Sedimentimonas flavescens TaxID=2851012 RepID=UPI0021A3F629|nr:GNAT family N-acetyltransferase [Sedimentimonas flavescens]MCT2539454.1 GNAT family N-acetyltransferase [Sedimentimonas flavescens]